MKSLLGQVADPRLAGAGHLVVLLHAATDVGGDGPEVDAEGSLADGLVVGVRDHAVDAASLVGDGELVPPTVGPLAGAVLPRGVVHPVGARRVVQAVLDLDVRLAPEGAFAVGVHVRPGFDIAALVVRRVDALRVGRGTRRARHRQQHCQCGPEGRDARHDASHLMCLSARVCRLTSLL